MANTMVPDFEKFMNNHVDALELLSTKISKAISLAFIVRQTDLDEVPEDIQHDYFWVLIDYLNDALECNETQLKELMQTIRKTKLQPYSDNNVQKKFIDNLITNQSLVSVYISNGIRLRGYLISHDNETVFLKDNMLQMIYKTRISAILPETDFINCSTHKS